MAHIITKPRCAVCSVWKVWIQFFDMFAIFDFQFFPFSIFSILNLLDHSMRIIKKDFFHFIFCWFFNSFPAIKCSLSLFFSYKIPTNYFKFWLNQKCNCLQILRGLFRFLYQSNLWLCFRVGVFFFFFQNEMHCAICSPTSIWIFSLRKPTRMQRYFVAKGYYIENRNEKRTTRRLWNTCQWQVATGKLIRLDVCDK